MAYMRELFIATAQWYCISLCIFAFVAFFHPAPKPPVRTYRNHKVLQGFLLTIFLAIVVAQIASTWRAPKELGWFAGFVLAMFSEPLFGRVAAAVKSTRA